MRTFFTIKNLSEGTYYWSVQAIDNAFAGSAFAPEQTLVIANNKTLNVNVFLDGLYNGSGLNKAQDAFGDHFLGNVADQMSIELRNNTSPYNVVHTINNVALNTNGTSASLLPATYSGNYYIAIKHRNSIETWSANPVSFAGSTINYSFDSPLKAYGNNMGVKTNGTPVLYGGDSNQDGIVDGSDLSGIGNQADFATAGYIPEDINGDGLIDGSDLSVAGNNADSAIGVITP